MRTSRVLDSYLAIVGMSAHDVYSSPSYSEHCREESCAIGELVYVGTTPSNILTEWNQGFPWNRHLSLSLNLESARDGGRVAVEACDEPNVDQQAAQNFSALRSSLPNRPTN